MKKRYTMIAKTRRLKPKASKLVKRLTRLSPDNAIQYGRTQVERIGQRSSLSEKTREPVFRKLRDPKLGSTEKKQAIIDAFNRWQRETFDFKTGAKMAKEVGKKRTERKDRVGKVSKAEGVRSINAHFKAWAESTSSNPAIIPKLVAVYKLGMRNLNLEQDNWKLQQLQTTVRELFADSVARIAKNICAKKGSAEFETSATIHSVYDKKKKGADVPREITPEKVALLLAAHATNREPLIQENTVRFSELTELLVRHSFEQLLARYKFEEPLKQ